MVYLRLLIIGLLLIFFGCEKVDEPSEAPQKPASIPSESIWVGGVDGGVFVLIKKKKNPDPNEYWGEIYYVSGDLAYRGPFQLHPEESGGFELKDPNAYQGWDGDNIYLTDDRQLRVVE